MKGENYMTKKGNESKEVQRAVPESDLPAGLAKPAVRALTGAGYGTSGTVRQAEGIRGSSTSWHGSQSDGAASPRYGREGAQLR